VIKTAEMKLKWLARRESGVDNEQRLDEMNCEIRPTLRSSSRFAARREEIGDGRE
jgi:hypothetical protein